MTARNIQIGLPREVKGIKINAMDDHSDSMDQDGEGEGVWSPDIEQCFREALLLFPPCGRRKRNLTEEGGGKMYGRNELIARHIMMRTGKVRTRKQVSSHIQVLARRKAKADTSTGGPAGSSSPASSMVGNNGHHRLNNRPDSTGSHNQMATSDIHHHHSQQQQQQQMAPVSYYDVWRDRPIVTQRIRLVEFSAFIEYRDQANNGIQPMPMNHFNSSNHNHHQQQQQMGGLASLASAAAASSAMTTSAPNTPTLALDQQASNGVQSKLEPVFSLPVSNSLQPSQQASPHPLASNHHLSGQFNQATTGPTNYQQQPQAHQLQQQQQPLNNNHQQRHLNQQGTDLYMGNVNSGNMNQLQSGQAQLGMSHQSSSGFVRHSYVKIDYRQPMSPQAIKLERIDISQIQDKFDGLGGQEGLFQQGPSDAFFLVKFWADLSDNYQYNIEDQNSYFGFSSHFETNERYDDITCSTKVCSYGRLAVEKVETIYGAFNNLNGRYSYDINRSPMSEFMIQFIKKLRQLPLTLQMNQVLENFTVLQVITSESTSEILLCLAYVFEISQGEQAKGSQYHVYKLTKD